jgi:hypothetical protein
VAKYMLYLPPQVKPKFEEIAFADRRVIVLHCHDVRGQMSR